jgi:predicted transcriptional regulator
LRTILLSVNPEYSNKIITGIKKYEYRKRIAQESINAILIYSTAPDMKVIGKVEVLNIISGSPTKIGELTKANAGISRKKYREYFKGVKTAYAYKLGNVEPFIPSKSLADFNIKTAPQSFVYIKNS